MNSEIIAKQEEIKAKQLALGEVFASHKDETGQYKMSPEILSDVQAKNAELEDLRVKCDAMIAQFKAAEEIRKANEQAIASMEKKSFNAGSLSQVQAVSSNQRGSVQSDIGFKSIGRQFIESPMYRQARQQALYKSVDVDLPDVEYKTLMTTSAGFAPANPRTDIVVLSVQETPTIEDVIPQITTDLTAVKFMEETTYTNNTSFVNEGSANTDSALAFTELTTSVQKILTWIPVTEEQLQDVPGMEGLINNRLLLMHRQTRQSQVLTGNGSSPNLRGFLNVSGIQTQAKGTDEAPDAIFKLLTKLQVTGGAMPSHIVIHPNDWLAIRLLRESGTGQYIWGSPADASKAPIIWGLNVIPTTSITENTALVGDFRTHAAIYNRKGIQLSTSDSHGTYFTEGKFAVKLTSRLALVVFRPAAFGTVTGI